MKKLVILGGRGIGMIAANIAEELGKYEVLGFLNDYVSVGEEIGLYRKHKVIGTSQDVNKYLSDPEVCFFVAYIGMKNEQEVFEKVTNLAIPPERFETLIHPSAILPKGYCKIGNGVLIAPLAQLSPDTTIEDNCILLANSFLGHDSIMKRFSHITTNSVIGGNVTVGYGAHVGSNATIKEDVNIGNFTIIGSGTVVLKDTPSNSFVVGNPGKVIKIK